MSNWFSPLLFLLATSSEEDLRSQIKFLKAENKMLRLRFFKKRFFLSNDERERLLKLGEATGPEVLKHIMIVHQRKDNCPLARAWNGIDEPLSKREELVCQIGLGGMLKDYKRQTSSARLHF